MKKLVTLLACGCGAFLLVVCLGGCGIGALLIYKGQAQPGPPPAAVDDDDCPDGKCPVKPKRKGDRGDVVLVGDFGRAETEAFRAAGPSDGGNTVTIHLPDDEHIKNAGGTDGKGLCVFAANCMTARYQNVRPMFHFFDFMLGKPGGGHPEKFAAMVRECCDRQGLPVPEFIQSTTGDVHLLELALKTGRSPSVTYGGRDDVYYKDRIRHMVTLVYLSSTKAAILDNNYPHQYLWMTRAEFVERFNDEMPGWCVIWLGPPPPPIPVNDLKAPVNLGGGPGLLKFVAAPPPAGVNDAEPPQRDEADWNHAVWDLEANLKAAADARRPDLANPLARALAEAKRGREAFLLRQEAARRAAAVQARGEGQDAVADIPDGLLRVKQDYGPRPLGGRWVRLRVNPDLVSYQINGRVVGYWSIKEQCYQRFDYDRNAWLDRTLPPEPVPAEFVAGVRDFGVDVERTKGSPKYMHNERGCGRNEFMDCLGYDAAGELKDDSKKLRITVNVKNAALRKRIMADMESPPLAKLRESYLIQEYAPSEWAVKDAGYTEGIFLTDPPDANGKGRVYWQLPIQDYAGPDKFAEYLRQKDPRYNPLLNPNPAAGVAGRLGWGHLVAGVLVAAGAFLCLVLLAVAFFVRR